MDTHTLKQIEEQVQASDKIQLDAAFGVLVKDYAAYLASNPRDDAKLFEQVYADFSKEETASYGGSPFFRPAEEVGIPHGFAAQAAVGVFHLVDLNSRSIRHEWTTIPGQRLLRRFAKELKGAICGPGGPYEQSRNGLFGQADLPKTIAASILAAGFSPATFWYPLAVYLALLIVKAGLATYCKTGEVGNVG
jgi:hypothetical protein